MLYAFFWVIPRRLNVICRRFGTLCLFHLHRRVGAYEDGTECSEKSVYKIQTPGNYPEESIEREFLCLKVLRLRTLVLLIRVVNIEQCIVMAEREVEVLICPSQIAHGMEGARSRAFSVTQRA